MGLSRGEFRQKFKTANYLAEPSFDKRGRRSLQSFVENLNQ